MTAKRLVYLLMLLPLNAAFAQQSVPLPTTNAAVTNTASRSFAGSRPQDLKETFRSDADTQKFWPVTLKDWIGLIQGLSVIAASFVALYGINSWRREFVGKRRMELAEEVLALFYQAKDIVSFIRSPGGFAGEGSTRRPESGETPEQEQIRNDAYVTFERYNKHGEVFSRIHALRYRFMAQFGTVAIAPFSELESILNEIFVAGRQRGMLSEVNESTFSNPQRWQEHLASIEKHERVLLGGCADDPVSPRVEKVVEEIERICRSQIERKG